MSLHGKKRRIVVSSSDEDDEGPAAAPPKQRKRRSEPATAAEILRAAEACKRDVLAAFPEYKPALRGVAIEVSSRMQTSGAKTIFNAETLRPRCVRISSQVFGERENLETALSDVVRHELAHAIAGREAAHGKEWRRVCRRIGGSAALYHTLSGQGCQGDDQEPPQRGRAQTPAATAQPRARARGSGKRSAGADRDARWRSASDSLISRLIRF